MPRIAVIGCGYWGKNLVRNFAEIGALEALVDVDDRTIASLIAKHGGRRADLNEALTSDKIDGVAIAAPAATHYGIAKQALQAGKHVFVEKPLALAVREAEALCDLADRQQRTLMVGHLLQYHPAFLALRELVRAGRLGRLQYIYSNRLNFGLIRQEEDILWSFAPHDISMILALVDREPSRVEAVGACYLHPTIADATTTHLTFPGGEQAHVFVSWLHPMKEQKLVVIGDAGMAVFDDGEPWDRKLIVFPHKTEWVGGVPRAVKADGQPVGLDTGEPLNIECRHFLDCISNGTKPRTDGREGLRVLSVLARATASLTQQRNNAESAVTQKNMPRFPGVTIHESTYVDDDVNIGTGTKIWHFSHILDHTRIGQDVIIGQNVVIGPSVTVGNKCKIQNNVSIYRGVTLEDGVFCGPSCVFTNVNNPRAEIERKSEFRPTLVKRGSTIGANATIVCGVTLGEYCFIAAGAVVTRNVPAFALMAGVPAHRIGWMSHSGERLGADLTCPATGPDRRSYHVKFRLDEGIRKASSQLARHRRR
jgi:predicted dehydrogenase/acetyltransferase-like isoleucine patch superfamily enzyme